MISVSIDGRACWLLPYPPGDKTALSLSVTFPVNTERSLTGATLRRPEAVAPRYTFDYRAILLRADFFALRAATLAAQDEPILAPLWPHAYRPGVDTPTMTAGLVVAYKSDWSAYAINPGSYAGFDYVAPLIYCHFRQPPRLVASADGFISADFTLDESAPVNYGFAPVAGILPVDTNYVNASGFSAPVFPFVPDWSKIPEPGVAVTTIDRVVIGPGRQSSDTFYPQAPEQIYTANFSGIGAADAAQIIAWWMRRCGGADAHWVATSQAAWHLSASAPAGATSITLALDTPAPALGSDLALCGAQVEFVRVKGVAGTVLTLAAPLANDWDAGSARVTPAMLARHTSPALVIDYSPAGWIAAYKLSWREVAAEYTPATGETRGVTLGRLPGSAWFYKIDLDYNGSIASTYLTSWESGAIANGFTWTYNPCDFDKLIQSLDLADDSCTFRMRWYAGCPFENWQPGVLNARGFLTIYRADVDASGNFSNFTAVWKGELSTPAPEGPNLTVKVLGANALFARNAPRQVMSTLCGTNRYSARCAQLLSDWTFNGTVVSVAGNTIVVGTLSRANAQAMPASFSSNNFFALGWMGWTSGGNPARVGVLASTANGTLLVTLTLDRASTLLVGTTVLLVPGCDRQGSTCRTNFNNYANFRGFEYMPAVSPNFIIPQNQTNGAKK